MAYFLELVTDQTPTPTRFLRNCEETGLFQELEANPFEQVSCGGSPELACSVPSSALDLLFS